MSKFILLVLGSLWVPSALTLSPSPFRTFVTHVFTLYPPPRAVEATTAATMGNKSFPDPKHFTEPPSNDIMRIKKANYNWDARKASYFSRCNPFVEDVSTQCMMKNTSLLCHPDTRTCRCFSWTHVNAAGLLQPIMNENDLGLYTYLRSVGAFLRLEMLWNQEQHECQSLIGSACFNPGSHPVAEGSHYVRCFPPLTCQQVVEDGVHVSRCLDVKYQKVVVPHRPRNVADVEGAAMAGEAQNITSVTEESPPLSDNALPVTVSRKASTVSSYNMTKSPK